MPNTRNLKESSPSLPLARDWGERGAHFIVLVGRLQVHSHCYVWNGIHRPAAFNKRVRLAIRSTCQESCCLRWQRLTLILRNALSDPPRLSRSIGAACRIYKSRPAFCRFDASFRRPVASKTLGLKAEGHAVYGHASRTRPLMSWPHLS